MLKKTTLVIIVATILSITNSYGNQLESVESHKAELEEMVSAFKNNKLIIKDTGIFVISVELGWWEKIKNTMSFQLSSLMNEIIKFNKEVCFDISKIMGKPALFVVKKENAQSIKSTLEKEGYKIEVKELKGLCPIYNFN